MLMMLLVELYCLYKLSYYYVYRSSRRFGVALIMASFFAKNTTSHHTTYDSRNDGEHDHSHCC